MKGSAQTAAAPADIACGPVEGSSVSVTREIVREIDGASLWAALRRNVEWNLSVEKLVEIAVARGEGVLSDTGALAVQTGRYTGRSPADKFTVRRPPSAEQIDWSSRFNLPIAPEAAARIVERFVQSAAAAPRLYGFQGFIGQGPRRLPVALIAEKAWHALMARHMYVRPAKEEPPEDPPGFTLLYLPSVRCDPERDGTASETVVLCDIERRLGVIGGTSYGGEEKKFFFYLMNYLLPQDGVLPMHCAASVGAAGDTTLIFGLSGTGKTTLSTDPDRRLLGDDEHAWDSDGVFNLEGGCYAKLIRLSQKNEPLIWDAVNRPGSILENVPLREGKPDFADESVENTRGVYPLEALPDVELDGQAGHPTTIVFLTFDASGTLPPVSVLEEDQALYWFLAGYTAKVAGTERGLGSRPEPTFSACLGAPFLPLHPSRYVDLMRRYLQRHRPLVVLMNTGALGAPYGEGGERTPIAASRAMLRGAQSGELRTVRLERHPQYGILIPESCPGVDPALLDPRKAWRGDAGDYTRRARELVAAFHKNVNDRYAGQVDQAVLDAGPPR